MTSEERKAWLRSLKVGDLVESKWPDASAEQATVERVAEITETIIETAYRLNERAVNRYRRNTGRETGKFGRGELHPVTEAAMDKSDRLLLSQMVSDWNCRNKFSITTVRKLLSLLTEAEREAGKENQ